MKLSFNDGGNLGRRDFLVHIWDAMPGATEHHYYIIYCAIIITGVKNLASNGEKGENLEKESRSLARPFIFHSIINAYSIVCYTIVGFLLTRFRMFSVLNYVEERETENLNKPGNENEF